MKRWISYSFFLVLIIMGGCSSVQGAVDNTYPLEDIVYDDRENKSEIYRASNQTVTTVANQIMDTNEPMYEASKNDRHLMIYDDLLVQVFEDPKDANDSLVEMSGEEFVRNNYSTAFFSDYGIAREAEEEFDMDFESRGGGFLYTGYILGGGYVKNSGKLPTLKYSSDSPGGIRGGGPGTGK